MKPEELKGIDYKQGLERFSGNAELYEKFLVKFAMNEEAAKAAELLESGDIEGAFFVIHTLKGTSGNLSINGLYSACVDFTKEYKSGNHGALPLLLEVVTAENESVIQQIRLLDSYSRLAEYNNER